MSNMKWVETPITKEQYEEGVSYQGNYIKQEMLAKRIAGSDIVYGYGLYGFTFKKRTVDDKDEYVLAMHIGDTCD